MDSTVTIIRHLFTDTLQIDSINNDLIELKSIILRNSSTSNLSSLVPLFSSIVGGLLVWVGQYLQRKTTDKSDNKKSRLEIYASCRKLEAAMKNHYRELAMAKIHVEYWWYCYKIELGPTPNVSRAYEEHLRSQAFAREVERQIGSTKADFIGYVRKFQALKSLPNEIEMHLKIISDLTNSSATPYSTDIKYNDLRDIIVVNDENELRNRYYLNLLSFEKVNTILQSLLN